MTATGIMLVILLVAALMAPILLCVAMLIIVSTIDKESWDNNDMGKGGSNDEED